MSATIILLILGKIVITSLDLSTQPLRAGNTSDPPVYAACTRVKDLVAVARWVTLRLFVCC